MPDGSLMTRAVPIGPRTFDPATGRVVAVLSSGLPVRGEILSTDPAAWTVTGPRLPLLDAHRRDSIAAVIGHVESIRTEGGQIIGDVTITDERARALVEAGTLGISVGYAVKTWRDDVRGGVRVRTATAWRLSEASLVPIAADPGSGFRSEVMPDTNVSDAQNRAAVNQSIRSLATRHSLGDDFANGLIDAGSDLPAARDAALAEIERRAAAAPTIRAHVGETNDSPDVIRTRCADALTHRMGALAELPEPAAQFRALGLAGMSRVMLAARGERVIGLSDEAVLTRAMTTGDLPNLLQSSGNRTLLASYEAARSPVLDFFRRTEGRDFRTMSRLRLGELALLDRVPENGEVKHGGVGESAEAYAIESFAKMFALTRKAVVNDDLNAFGQITAMQGRQAAETLNNAAVGLLTQGSGLGPVMSDGQRMFHATHGNVASTAAAPGESAFAAGLAAMRAQKGLDGVSPINVVPRFLLVPPEFEVDASHALAELFPETAENVNSLGRSLTLMVEPRLTGQRWYLFADPAIFANFEVAYLASAPAPQMESRPGWDVLGVEFRCVFDFGVGAVDWRGAFTNEGDAGLLGGDL